MGSPPLEDTHSPREMANLAELFTPQFVLQRLTGLIDQQAMVLASRPDGICDRHSLLKNGSPFLRMRGYNLYPTCVIQFVQVNAQI